MVVYMDAVVLLNFAVDFLLLQATNRLCGCAFSARRLLVASLFGGIYAGVCVLPGFSFMGNMLWRLVFLVLMSYIAFGFGKSALRKGAIFVLLSMALGGIATVFSRGGFAGILLSIAVIFVLCITGFGGQTAMSQYVPVELQYTDRKLQLTALVDTGNTLRDPITGCPVLVVGAHTAMQLLGLTKKQLQEPLESMKSAGIPGLRLVPYRTVGKEGGMLLALRLKGVKIGNWKGSSVVAFAPEGLENEESYQALTGGFA